MKIYLAGEHIERPGSIYYWELPAIMQIKTEGPDFYDNFAIVECKNSIAMVKVVGYLKTNNQFRFGHKKVLALINEENVKSGALNRFNERANLLNSLQMMNDSELKKNEVKECETEESSYKKTIERMKRLGINKNDHEQIIRTLSQEIEMYRNKICEKEKYLNKAISSEIEEMTND